MFVCVCEPACSAFCARARMLRAHPHANSNARTGLSACGCVGACSGHVPRNVGAQCVVHAHQRQRMLRSPRLVRWPPLSHCAAVTGALESVHASGGASRGDVAEAAEPPGGSAALGYLSHYQPTPAAGYCDDSGQERQGGAHGIGVSGAGRGAVEKDAEEALGLLAMLDASSASHMLSGASRAGVRAGAASLLPSAVAGLSGGDGQRASGDTRTAADASDSASVSQGDWDDSVQDLEISGQSSTKSRDYRDAPEKHGTWPDGGHVAPDAVTGKQEEAGLSKADDFSLTLSDDTPSILKTGGSFGEEARDQPVTPRRHARGAVGNDEVQEESEVVVQEERHVQVLLEDDAERDQGRGAVARPFLSGTTGPSAAGRKASPPHFPKAGSSGGGGSVGSGGGGEGGESSSEACGSRPSSRLTDAGSRPSSRLTDAAMDGEGAAGASDLDSAGRSSMFRPPLPAPSSRPSSRSGMASSVPSPPASATGVGSSASSSSSHTSAAAVRRRMEMAAGSSAGGTSKGTPGKAPQAQHAVDIHEVAGRLRRGEVVGDEDASWMRLLQVFLALSACAQGATRERGRERADSARAPVWRKRVCVCLCDCVLDGAGMRDASPSSSAAGHQERAEGKPGKGCGDRRHRRQTPKL